MKRQNRPQGRFFYASLLNPFIRFFNMLILNKKNRLKKIWQRRFII
ncbi:hypothetical protein CSC17_1005 [Klebsiella oxytoca]|nr:hypothetical protein CSC17_1005 [Klebsiella oxytoca]